MTSSFLLSYSVNIKSVLQIKLLPSNKVKLSLIKTMEVFNEACNYISEEAFRTGTFSKFKLQQLVYHAVKNRFSLSAQLAILAVHKVAASYKLNKNVLSEFRPRGAMTYDSRVMRLKGMNLVNLWTLDGRKDILVIIGEYQKGRWFQIKGQADLVFVDNTFYLLVTQDVPEDTPIEPKGFIGVDLGIKNIATSSDGQSFCGSKLESKRQKFHNHRRSLQKKGTKSAKRHLKKIANKEARFRKDTNHCISKQLAQIAKDTCQGISFENLKDIRSKTTVRKSQRAQHCGWSFHQLQKFTEYKAKRFGVPVTYIAAAYTSQECSDCGHTERKNRRTQSQFLCVSCGYSDHADRNASLNIQKRAEASSSCGLS